MARNLNKIIPLSGEVSKAAVRSLSGPRTMKRISKVIERKAKKEVAHPMRNAARVHYSNMLDNAVDFIEESGVDNASSGFQTFTGISAEGTAMTFRSLVPWDSLDEKYAAKKTNPYMWRNTGYLASYAQPERAKNKVFASKVKSVKESTSFYSRSLGQFTFDLKFQRLHPVLSQILQTSFTTGTSIKPTALLPVIPMNRKSLSRLMFLERRTQAGTRGGRGRPMLTSIAGKLGKMMLKDLSALNLGKFR